MVKVTLGIDIGSTNIKVAVFDITTNRLVELHKRTTPKYVKANVEYFDIEKIYQSVEEILQVCQKQYSILAVSAASVGESVVPIFEDGSYKDPIVWYDNATANIAEEFWKKNDKGKVYEITGLAPSHIYSIFKIKFVNEKLFNKAVLWLPISSFILYKLGAEPCWDYSQASRTSLLNVENLDWDDYLLEFAGLSRSNLPKLAYSGANIGFWKIKDNKIPIFLGAHDHIAGMFVIDKLYKKGDFIYDSMGTAESFTILADKNLPLSSDDMDNNVNKGIYVTGTHIYIQRSIILSGGLIDWLYKLFGLNGKDLKMGDSETNYFKMEVHNSSMGTSIDFIGVPYNAGPDSFLLSTINFISERSKEIVDYLKKKTNTNGAIFISGGLIMNPIVKEVKMKHFVDEEVFLLKSPELTAVGAALLGIEGLGIHTELNWDDYVN
ncbi:MAG: FGGY family carbohydrate kinase [Nitrososphaeria archaeon]